MIRRDFLKNITVTAAGIILLDQLEPIKRFWPGADFKRYVSYNQAEFTLGFKVSNLTIEDDLYLKDLFRRGNFKGMLRRIEEMSPNLTRVDPFYLSKNHTP